MNRAYKLEERARTCSHYLHLHPSCHIFYQLQGAAPMHHLSFATFRNFKQLHSHAKPDFSPTSAPQGMFGKLFPPLFFHIFLHSHFMISMMVADCHLKVFLRSCPLIIPGKRLKLSLKNIEKPSWGTHHSVNARSCRRSHPPRQSGWTKQKSKNIQIWIWPNVTIHSVSQITTW